MRRVRVGYVAAVLALVLMLAGGIVWYVLSRPQGAPAVSELPLGHGIRELAASEDPGNDNIGSFRDIAIAGPAREPVALLARQETTFLIESGWSDAVTSRFVVVGQGSVEPRRVPIGTLGSLTMLKHRAAQIYAGFEPVATINQFEQAADGDAIYGSRTVRAAIANHRPLLVVTLGNGTHG